MASGDLYELHLIGHMGNQDTLNVFHYLQTSGSGGAANLANGFGAVVLPDLREVMTTGAEIRRVFAKDKANPTDFGTNIVNQAGFVTDSSLPVHLTWSFTYISNRLDARSGGKRFSGIGETMLSSGVATLTYQAKLVVLAATLESNITLGADSWRPVIYGKRYIAATQEYTEAYFANPLAGVDYLGVTSQNNRKFYTSPGL